MTAATNIRTPTAPWESVFNDDRTRDEDGQAYVELKLDGELAEDKRFMARVYHDWYTYDGHFIYDYGVDGLSDWRDRNRASSYGCFTARPSGRQASTRCTTTWTRPSACITSSTQAMHSRGPRNTRWP